MTDLSWLNFIPVAAFAFRVEAQSDARILFWNDAMEDHADISSEQARSGALTAISQRLRRAAHNKIKSANLGSLGTFKLQPHPDGFVIAVYSAGATQAVEDEKVLFLAMAAHDLRTPLLQIFSIVDEVRDGFQDLGDGKLEMLSLIDIVAEQARAFTDDVITYTRATQIHLEQIGPVDISAFASEIFHSVDLTKKHTFSCAQGCVDVDQVALRVALRNLFDNATRHAISPMAIHLDVDTIIGAGMVRFTISDSGNGLDFPAEFFEMARANRHSSSFGLLGVQRIIEGRGGTVVGRKSQNEAGSAIAFTLPGATCSADQVSSLG